MVMKSITSNRQTDFSKTPLKVQVDVETFSDLARIIFLSLV